jgi:hypothetical protein
LAFCVLCVKPFPKGDPLISCPPNNQKTERHFCQQTKKQKKTIDNDGMTDGRQIIIIFFPVILRQIG